MEAAQLADALRETGRKHHQAFISSDGVDPEWPRWYAPFIQAALWDELESLPTQSELIHLLVAADRAHRAGAEDEPWPDFYARFILDNI